MVADAAEAVMREKHGRFSHNYFLIEARCRRTFFRTALLLDFSDSNRSDAIPRFHLTSSRSTSVHKGFDDLHKVSINSPLKKVSHKHLNRLRACMQIGCLFKETHFPI